MGTGWHPPADPCRCRPKQAGSLSLILEADFGAHPAKLLLRLPVFRRDTSTRPVRVAFACGRRLGMWTCTPTTIARAALRHADFLSLSVCSPAPRLPRGTNPFPD